MAKEKITAKNIRSNKTVTVPEPGRIVSLTRDLRDYTGKWQEPETMVCIVMSHADHYDPIVRKDVPKMEVLSITGKTYIIPFSHIVKATTTRSIPPKARDTLRSIYKWNTSEKAKWDAKVTEIQQKRSDACRASGAWNPKQALADAMGALSEDAFNKRVHTLLCERLGSFKRDGWQVGFFWDGEIKVWRDVDIMKWYSGPLSFLEYDDCRCLVPDAEDTEEGQRHIRKSRKTLPVAAELEEELALGDKNWLEYRGCYKLAKIGEHELLTEALAEKIVSDFCG